MAIETTEFADVSIAVSPTGVSGGNFGILGFLTKFSDTATNPISPAERARAYTSLKSVGGDWPASSETYKAATAFYSQSPTPTDFVALMNYDTAQAAQLVGGGTDEIEDIVAINAGEFNITIDSVDFTSSAVDLSGASTHTDVASLLTSLIAAVVSGATVTYGAYGYVVSSPVTGALSTITYASGDVAVALGLDQSRAKVSGGVDAETAVDSLAAALSLGIEWVGTVTHKDFRDVVVADPGVTSSTLEIAQWCEAAKRIFCNTTNDLSVLNPAISTDVASVLKSAALRFSLTTFSKSSALYPSASVFGRAASVNFSGINTTLTLNLKQMPGVVAENLTPAEFGVLRSKNASAVVQIGKSVTAYTDSRVASGSWLDTTHGLLWLENRCEVDMFNLLYQQPTKVPFTQAGINTSAATLEGSLQAAVRNGLAGPGFLPDGTYLPEGYRIHIVELGDVASSDKSNRLYAGLSFDMVGAGALHEVVVSGNFTE